MAVLKVIDARPSDVAGAVRLPGLRWQRFTRPPVVEPDPNGSVEARAMAAEEAADPDMFRVESRAQFADGVSPYFQRAAVAKVFEPYGGRTLTRRTSGELQYDYRVHCDPALVNDFFSVMVAHGETAPADGFGIEYGHIVVDFYRVWRPQEFDHGRIDYTLVAAELRQLMTAFRPVSLTMDQFNSAYLLQDLHKWADRMGLPTECTEATATAASNAAMYEALKFSVNTGLVHCYADDPWRDDQNRTLLRAQLDAVQWDHGRVVKPRSAALGHLDLVDCLAQLVVQLTGDQSTVRRDMLLGSSAVTNADVFADRTMPRRTQQRGQGLPRTSLADLMGR